MNNMEKPNITSSDVVDKEVTEVGNADVKASAEAELKGMSLEDLEALLKEITDYQEKNEADRVQADNAAFEARMKDIQSLIDKMPADLTSQEKTNQEVERDALAQQIKWKMEAMAAKDEKKKLESTPDLRGAIKSIEDQITKELDNLGEETSDTPSYWSNLNKETGDMLRHITSLKDFALKTGIDDSLASNLTGLALQRINDKVTPAIDEKIELLSKADAANTPNAALAFGVRKKLEDIKFQLDRKI